MPLIVKILLALPLSLINKLVVKKRRSNLKNWLCDGELLIEQDLHQLFSDTRGNQLFLFVDLMSAVCVEDYAWMCAFFKSFSPKAVIKQFKASVDMSGMRRDRLNGFPVMWGPVQFKMESSTTSFKDSMCDIEIIGKIQCWRKWTRVNLDKKLQQVTQGQLRQHQEDTVGNN